MDDELDDLFDGPDDPYDEEGPGLFDDALEFDPDDEPESAAPADAAPTSASTSDGETQPTAETAESGEPAALAAEAATPAPSPATAATKPAAARPDAPEAPLALYRRYRPDTFGDVIGQEHVTEPLQRALVNNKVNHAYLFSGPRGCGKTSSARILARCLNCEQGPTPTPCGVCQSCRDLATGGTGSIDVIEMDAASHGGVNEARDLRERAFFAPVASRYKIYIIDEAHMVTKEGFNALLKLVEEPPPHVKFIFATTEPEKVIGTIRSRTHHYPFRLVPPRTLTNYLAKICAEEHVEVEAGVLPLVVRAGGGSVRDSLSVLDQLLGSAGDDGVTYASATGLLGYTPDTLLDDIVDAFAAGDARGVFATVDKVIEVGQDPRRFAEDLLQRFRDLVIVAQVPDAISSGLIDVPSDQGDRLTTQAAGLGAGELTRAAQVIATGLTDMRGTTAPRLHLELMCARVLLPGADVDGRGVHARLDRIERRLAVSAPDEDETEADGPAVARAGVAESSPTTDSPAEPPPAQRRPAGPRASATADETQAPPAQRRPAAQDRPSAQDRPAAQDRPVGQGQPDGPDGASEAPPAQRRPASTDRRRAPSQTQRGGDQRRPAAAPEPTPEPAPTQSVGRPSASGAELSAVELRRAWPQVLDKVKERRRFTWIILSQNAQVADVADGVLTLQFSNPGARDSFASGGSDDVLRDVLVDQLGADLRIVGVLADEQPAARQQRSEGTPPAASQAGRSPEPPPEYEEDEVSDYDTEVDSAASATELLTTQLGAQVIEQQPDE